MTQELKPCPFCGGEAVAETGSASSWVACRTPGCDCEQFHYTMEAAFTAWNTRAPASPVDAAADDLLAALVCARTALILYTNCDDLISECGAAIAKATGQQVAA